MKPSTISRYNVAVTWIYLSPHFDDVALSCGGLVWEQTRAGKRVSIWTICGGPQLGGELSPFAKSLHTRWEAGRDRPVERKFEDINSCHRLGASYRHFSLPDCIYRRNPINGEYMYTSEPALNGSLHPGDGPVAQDLQEELSRLITMELTVVCPLALGNHVDHQLTRLAAEMLGLVCLYYADFPYALQAKTQLEQFHEEGWESQCYPISDEGLVAWQDSIYAHGSQISTFWPNEADMRQVVGQYRLENGGIRLWRRPSS